MGEENKKRIEELIAEVQCPKGFKCVDSNSEDFCKAKDCGLKNYVECIEHNPHACKFALRFGGRYYCCCPFRVYFAKGLKK